jgi:peptidylprolyl isomerase
MKGKPVSQAKEGDTVKVHYTGKLENGTEFDSSSDGDPLEFKLGEGELIPGFEQAVVGMASGEKKTVTIPVEEAYGPRRDELVMVVEKSALPPDLETQVGEQLEMTQGDDTFVVTITEATDDSVTLDANHPLAGESLVFDLELVEIAG